VTVCTFDECTPEFLEEFFDPVDGRIFAKTLVKKSEGHGILIDPSDLL